MGRAHLGRSPGGGPASLGVSLADDKSLAIPHRARRSVADPALVLARHLDRGNVQSPDRPGRHPRDPWRAHRLRPRRDPPWPRPRSGSPVQQVREAVILTRAGHRCEHHHLLLGRCRTTDQLEADHIHPWSRGGQTALANGQALCKQHNRAKRATVPYGWQLRALERRRTTYFPEGLSGAVTRHTPRRSTGRRRAAGGEQSHSAT